jgi:hypothetical protein
MPITNNQPKAGFILLRQFLDNCVPITNPKIAIEMMKQQSVIQFDPPSKSPPNPIKEFINMMNRSSYGLLHR